MADLTLDWGLVGAYGSVLADGDGATSTSIETGGVAVDVAFDALQPQSGAFTFNAPGYVADGETFDARSHLKLSGNNPGDTSNTEFTFRSTDDDFGDEVQDVSFRLNDIDSGAAGDFGDGAGSGYQDILSITAFDADGNPVTVTITPSGDLSAAIDSNPEDPNGSALVEIAGPVSRIVIEYENSGDGYQGVMISDVEFSTTPAVPGEDPVAVDDTDTTPEDTAVIIDVLDNDSDPDGDPLTVTTATVDEGTVSINPDGTLTYTPPAGYTGPALITYTVEDPDGNTDTAVVTLSVTPDTDNEDPVAVDDSATTPEGDPIVLTPLANDSDPDGDPLTIDSIGTPSAGSAALNPDGTVTYTPDAGFVGTATIPYTIVDGNGGSDTGLISVTVTDDRLPPEAIDDIDSTATSTPVTIDVQGNDSDPDGTVLSTVSATDPANGTAAVNPDGSITYTPDAGFTGTDTFDYVIRDAQGLEDTGTVTVTVTDNAPPIAVTDNRTTAEDNPVTLDPTANDTDPEDDPLSVTSVGTPLNGTAVLNPDGTVTYTPDTGFIGQDTIPYIVNDGNGNDDTGEIVITVGANQPPVALDNLENTQEGTPVGIRVLRNDTDPDGDDLTVVTATDPTNGDIVIEADGRITYTPDAGFTGVDTFDYTIEDENGAQDTATVTVTVQGPGAPDADFDVAATDEDTAVRIYVLGNDTEPDGDPLTIVDTTDPSNGTATINPADGTITYTPDPGFSGVDTFTYTITDPDGNQDSALVTVTVAGDDNTAPDAVDDADTTDEGTPVVLDLIGNDTDPEGDPLIITSLTDPSNGTAVVNPDGTVTYTPRPGFTGEDSFDYTISDGNGGTDTATATITIEDGDNSAPDAVDDLRATDFDTPITLDPRGNDSDPESDPLSVTSVTDPANGTAAINPDGTVTYTPDAGFSGTDTFDYTIDDGNGGTDTATVTVTVAPEDNTAPDAVDDVRVTDPNTPIVIDTTANDSDPESDPLEITDITTPTNGTAVLNADGTVTYVPNPGFEGTDTFEYTITDGNGGTDTATVTITVGDDANSAPDAVDDVRTTDVDTPVTLDPRGNDSDPESDPLSVTSVTDPANGTAAINPDGTVTYTPDASFTGTDTFEYTISDGNGGTDTATVTITVEDDANSDPDAVDDARTTDFETPVTLDPRGNDSDPESDPLTVTSVTDPANGTATINPDGTVTYTPDATFSGTDTFDYTIDDGNGGTDTATVTITVEPEDNSDPDAVDDVRTTDVDTPVTLDPRGNDSDPESDPLSVTSVTDPANGSATINPDGTVTYTPDASFTGTDTFEYTISDGNGGTDTATVTITVEDDAVSDPIAVDDARSTDEGTPVTLDPRGNDSDPESDPLTVTSVTTPINGTAVINPDGTVTYTPTPGFAGTDTFDYTINDGNGGTDTATVTITVGDDDNDAPVAVDDAVTTEPGDPVTLDPRGNDSDPDGDPLTVTSVGTPTNGTAVINPDGTVTYTPNPGFTGTDTIPYTIDDGNGGTDDGVITVTVAEDPTGPGRIDTDVIPVAPGLQPLDPLNGLDEDPDPLDDLDDVDGTAGADTISTGDDADTIDGGAGDDVINPGVDDDLVTGGAGNDSINDVQGADTIDGGAGNDTIIAGVDTFSDYAGDDASFPFLGFDSDPNTDDGRDSILGGTGDDLIMTGDDADTIDGGDDDDTIDAGIDDDLVSGGAGDDSITAGHGSDTVDGGTGDDYIDTTNFGSATEDDLTDPQTENDRDSVLGGDGADTILTGDDDDTIDGGMGDDVIDAGIDDDSVDGGDGADTLRGGSGDDTLNGGAGIDSIHGGADADTIVISAPEEGIDDVVDGGFEGDDNDTLDLTGVGDRGEDWQLVDTRTDSDGNGLDGTVQFFDDAGNVTGTMDFFNIETIVPCFTPGTLIATPQGERLVEDLQEGDRVITRDNGIQEIKWVGRKDLTGFELARKPQLYPVLIQKGALGNGLPEHDTLVSPNHRVLVANDKTALYFEEREVLVAAKHLTGLDGVDSVEANGVSYIHFMFERHEVVLSNGAWTESFQPGDHSLKGIGSAQRQEILELFPELEEAEGLKAYGSARRSLKKHEAALLTK